MLTVRVDKDHSRLQQFESFLFLKVSVDFKTISVLQ